MCTRIFTLHLDYENTLISGEWTSIWLSVYINVCCVLYEINCYFWIESYENDGRSDHINRLSEELGLKPDQHRSVRQADNSNLHITHKVPALNFKPFVPFKAFFICDLVTTQSHSSLVHKFDFAMNDEVEALSFLTACAHEWILQ